MPKRMLNLQMDLSKPSFFQMVLMKKMMKKRMMMMNLDHNH